MARARIGTKIRGKWTVDKLLGVGGMGSVYAATHRNGSRVALKILHPTLSLDPEMRQRFSREGYAANAVGHPGVVRVHDDDETDDGAAFLVMDLLDGETAEARARRLGGTLPVDEVVRIGIDLLDVLAAAHAAGVVHRDIKPDNLFLERDGTLKVLDFGIARLREERTAVTEEPAESARLRTRTGVTMGTPAFMPPEQAMGRSSEVDALSDLWAAGATLFSLLTGKIVHDASTHMEVVIAAATAQARKLSQVAPQVPPGLCAIIDRALSFDKAARWPSAAAMRRALTEGFGEPVADESTAGSTGPGTLSRQRPAAASVSSWVEERRLATVMFIELLGLPSFGMDLEPDAAREIVAAYMGPVALDVEREGGTVAKYMGETVMVAFGVPAGREDDARRAARAALSVQKTVADVAVRRSENVVARVGAQTGLVMVGAIGAGSFAAIEVTGAAVNIATQIMRAAAPGECLVGAQTAAIIESAFETASAGELTLPGGQERVHMVRLLSERDAAASSVRATLVSELSFFARSQERERILAGFDAVVSSNSLRIIEIVSELGFGKSHLLRNVRATLEHHERKPRMVHCRTAVSGTVGVLDRVVRALFAVTPSEPADLVRARIAQSASGILASDTDIDAIEAGRVLAELIAPEPVGPMLGTELASGDVSRVVNTVGALLRQLAAVGPLVLILEGFDWTDGVALEQVAHFSRALRRSSVLLLLTARREGSAVLPPWHTSDGLRTRIELGPLSEEVMERLLEDLFRRAPAVPRDLKRDILRRSEGNPALCKELVRLLVDRGAVLVDEHLVPVGFNEKRSAKLTLPDTVRGVLQARIDGLPPVQKELLKLASVVGHTFWLGALIELSPGSNADEITRMLDALRTRELIRGAGKQEPMLAGEQEQVFASQVLWEVAYELVPRASRITLHRQVAEWLKTRVDPWHGGQAALAKHLEAGGEPVRARRLYLSAARQALSSQAYAEASEYFRRTLATWPAAAGADEHVDRSGVLRECAQAEMRLGRFEAALDALRRAEADLEAAGVARTDVAFAWIALECGLILKEFGRAPLSIAALGAGIELLKGAPPQLLHMRLYSARSFQLAATGDLEGAQRDFEVGLRMGQSMHVRDAAWHVGMARLRDAEALFAVHKGDLDGAEKAFRMAIDLREQAVDAQGMQDALVNLGGIAFSRGRFEEAVTHYEKALAQAKKLQWASREALGYSNLGQARLAAGNAESAVRDLTRATSLAEQGGYVDIMADSIRALIEAHTQAGAVDSALAQADLAIRYAEDSKNPSFVAMTHAALMDAYLERVKVHRTAHDFTQANAHRDLALAASNGAGQKHLATSIEARYQRASGATIDS
jgi:class 3 adenylate cyclase/tetratricopeptide (TPR) repeat protein